MTRPKLLDLFCGAGGCSVGYHRAGFDVTGWDQLPHPDYPFNIVVGDAMDALRDPTYLQTFDIVALSPPCPRFSAITPHGRRDDHPDLLTPALELVQAAGVPWIVENVVGAPVPNPVLMCGQAMGLPEIRRHRLFGSSLWIMSPGCGCGFGHVFGVYGDHGDVSGPVARPGGGWRGVRARDTVHAREVMGIDWMTEWDDLADAIPPAYTEYLGAQPLDQLVLT